MARTRVKVCGITCLEDAVQAVDAGADALGFVFYRPSPRFVEPAIAAKIIASLPAFVTTVALFVDEIEALVQRISTETGVDLLQFHGDEPVGFCTQFDRPYIKALRVKPDVEVLQQAAPYADSARGILLDTYRKGIPGGTGEAFDWDLVPEDLGAALILAGGLNAGNVGAAMAAVSPFAVDVSGGVEAKAGRKDPDKIQAFMDAVRTQNLNSST